MGMCLERTPEMGGYDVEVRRESFVLTKTENTRVEILIEDIPNVRAALDRVESWLQKK